MAIDSRNSGGHERLTGKHTDLVLALCRLLGARLLVEREQVLEEIEGNNWQWSTQDSTRLDALDEALTRLGHFDTRVVRYGN